MSKKEKQLKKLFAIPPPKDFTWDELLTVMRGAGFVESCNGGSHYTFEHTNGYRTSMSKTHPNGILKQYQVKTAKEALTTVGNQIGDSSNE